eukprot:SM002128S06615  [mRNA]  locus=s2128:1016:1715:- [translate_table: standard]
MLAFGGLLLAYLFQVAPPAFALYAHRPPKFPAEHEQLGAALAGQPVRGGAGRCQHGCVLRHLRDSQCDALSLVTAGRHDFEALSMATQAHHSFTN